MGCGKKTITPENETSSLLWSLINGDKEAQLSLRDRAMRRVN